MSLAVPSTSLPACLSTRSWTKWHLEHPWVKKLRPHKDETPDEYDHELEDLFGSTVKEAHTAIAAHHGLPPVPVEKIAHALHPTTVKVEPPVDRSPEYHDRDLHAEHVWPDRNHASRYGMVTFDSEGRVLLREPTNHFDGYAWTFPKGHPDSKDEHPLDAAMRENIEETGHVPAVVGHIPGGFGGSSTSSVQHYYLGHDTSGLVKPGAMSENGETSSLKWATPLEALQSISQSTNLNGRYRDLQVLKAAYEAYGALHPEHNFPPIHLPPPPPQPTPWSLKGKLFRPTDAPPAPKPSYSYPKSGHKSPHYVSPYKGESGSGPWAAKPKLSQGQQNFLAATAKPTTVQQELGLAKDTKDPWGAVMAKSKGKTGKGKRDDQDGIAERLEHRSAAFMGIELQVELETRNWMKWNAEHSKGGRKLSPAEYDKALKDEWAKGRDKAVSHVKKGKLSETQRAKLASHHIAEGVKAERENRHLDAARHRGKVRGYSDGKKVDHGKALYGKKGIFENMKMTAAQAKSMVKDSTHDHIPPLVMLAAMRDGMDGIETRNWTKWHEEHPYIPHPRKKGESVHEYDHRLKTDYAAWLRNGGARKVGDLVPGDRIHYGDEDHKVTAKFVHPKTGKVHLGLKGENSGEERTVIAGKTANVLHPHEDLSPREKVSPKEPDAPVRNPKKVGDLKPGDTIHHLGEDQTITDVVKHPTTGKMFVTMTGKESGKETVVKAGRTAGVVPAKGRAAGDKSNPKDTPTLTEDRRKRMFDSHKDALTKAQDKADAMPDKGEAFTADRAMTDAEYEAHRKHVEYESTRHGADDLMHSPFSTHVSEDKVAGAEGAYTPTRAKQQEAIIADVMKRAESVPDDHQAIIMGGPGGAGKSTILRRSAADPDSTAAKLGIKYASYAEHDDPENHIQKGDGIGDPINYVVLNPDDIKTEMARRGMVPTIDHLSPMEAAGPFAHEEASQIVQRIAARLTAQGKNVIWDITLNSEKSGIDRIDALRETPGGYHIAGAFVDVKLPTSDANARARHRHGQDDFNKGKPGAMGGRFVPSGLITSATDKEGRYASTNRASFEKLKAKGVFDHTLTYNNEGYAGELLDESGQSLAHRSDDATMPRTSDITDKIKAYRAGDMTFTSLCHSLATRMYAPPSHFDQADLSADDLESVARTEPGTWNEVANARDTGLLTGKEYDTIHGEMCRLHGVGK